LLVFLIKAFIFRLKFFVAVCSGLYHKILPHDSIPRVNYCDWFLHNTYDDILDVIFFTDEAWFHLEGYRNKIQSYLLI
ncbi:unnamed protein product, partial [Tenebrio molitor]